MTATAHLTVGAAAAVAAQRFLPPDAGVAERIGIAFAAGFASHLGLDAFPHQEYQSVGMDLAYLLFVEITAVMFVLLWPQNGWLKNGILFSGMVGGALPDVIELAFRYVADWPWLDSLGKAIHFFHGKLPIGFTVDFYLQFLIALTAVIFIKFFS